MSTTAGKAGDSIRGNVVPLILVVASLLFSASPLAAQDHLIPEEGIYGGLSDYDITVNHVFREGYSRNVRLRTLIKPSFGKEHMVGLTHDSTGYKLFSIVPDSSIYRTAWRETLCAESPDAEIISSENGSSNCDELDFSRSSSMQVNTTYVPVDTLKAQLLQDLWQEMLLESRYPPGSRLTNIVVDGVRYHFSARVSGYGTINAYTHSPFAETRPRKLADLARDIFMITMIEADEERELLMDKLYLNTLTLMKEVLEGGDLPPLRDSYQRMLSGCSPDEVPFNSSYCWQVELDGDAFPEFIIARERESSYSYQLVDCYARNRFRTISIIPVASLRARFSSVQESEYHVLKPWEILDIVTNSNRGVVQLWGYKEPITDDPTSDGRMFARPGNRILYFDAVRKSSGSYTESIQIDGESGWYSMNELFRFN